MSIKNYTSSVPADRSILKIESILIEMGATSVAKEYAQGKVISLSFAMTHQGRNTPFRLPVRKDSVKKLFLSQYKRPTAAQVKACEDRAERTAWKNVKEWVELQAVMIKLDQIDFMEIFMPYILHLESNKTVYEIAKENNFARLIGN
jgi:hypothetical protein